jgi:hypothetical protein
MGGGFLSVCDLRSFMSVRCKEVQKDIDEKEKINQINNFRTDAISLMPKGDLERNQDTAGDN